MIPIMSLKLQGLPPILSNVRNNNWRVTYGQKLKWQRATISHAVHAGLPEAPLKKAVIVLTRYSSSQPDYDGLVSSFKPIIDALIKAHVILDDNPSVVTVTYLWGKAPQKKGMITIEVYKGE